MAKAFLSHSSSDKNLVRKIASLLGIQRCVLDENSFEPGARTLDEIFRELDESDVFVLFISDKALNSEWVQITLWCILQLFRLAQPVLSYPRLSPVNTNSRLSKVISISGDTLYYRKLIYEVK